MQISNAHTDICLLLEVLIVAFHNYKALMGHCINIDQIFLSLIFGIQIDQKIAGETVDETLVNNTLMLYSEIGENTEKNEPKEFAKTMMKKMRAIF